MEVQHPAPLKLAVILPCYNEEQAIAKVVSDFKQVLPEASIYVFDNNSSDHTAEVAAQASAKVVFVGLKVRATWCGECLPTSRPIYI
jgi:glycosyltransferase involved in cell wall biosynthesis